MFPTNEYVKDDILVAVCVTQFSLLYVIKLVESDKFVTVSLISNTVLSTAICVAIVFHVACPVTLSVLLLIKDNIADAISWLSLLDPTCTVNTVQANETLTGNDHKLAAKRSIAC